MRRAAMIVLAVALAGVWPLYRAEANHAFNAIIGGGVVGPSLALLQREVPDLVVTNNKGHDGQQFYAIARHPFDPKADAPYLDSPVYRMRRILVPVLGWLLAPDGGNRLIAALLFIGLVGVALGAFSLSLLPDGPWWLPVTIGLTPGVIAATSLTLGDSLAMGLTLAAFAASARRRPALVLVALVLGTLTRETVYLAALALAVTPGLSTRWRVTYVVVPAAFLGAWVVWVAHALGSSVNQNTSDQLAFPLAGWWNSTGDAADMLIGGLTFLVIVVGMTHLSRNDRAVFVYLSLLLVLYISVSTEVTASWINPSRVVIAGVPLAVWAMTREPAPSTPAGEQMFPHRGAARR